MEVYNDQEARIRREINDLISNISKEVMDKLSFFQSELLRHYPIDTTIHGWTITAHEMKFETPYVACAEVTFVRAGTTRPYLVLLTRQGVAALVVTDDTNVILVRQLRFGTGTYHWELPQETLGDEKSEDAVARLPREHQAQNWTLPSCSGWLVRQQIFWRVLG